MPTKPGRGRAKPAAAWYVDAAARWAHEQSIAREFLAGASSEVGLDGRACIRGEYRLLSEHGREYGRFRVRIVYPEHFPFRGRHPNVYLDSHQVLWTNLRDSHIEHDWRLCLYVACESGIDFTRWDSLLQLFPCVHTFLLRERIYQERLVRERLRGIPAVWPGPQREHGIDGLRQAIAKVGVPGPNDPCICGSGEKFKRCHRNQLM
jgi:hypothetical protein